MLSISVFQPGTQGSVQFCYYCLSHWFAVFTWMSLLARAFPPSPCSAAGEVLCVAFAACARIVLTRCLIFHRYPFIIVSSSFPALLLFRGSWKSFSRLRVWLQQCSEPAVESPLNGFSDFIAWGTIEAHPRGFQRIRDFLVTRVFPLSQLLSSTSIGWNFRLEVTAVSLAISRSLVSTAIVCILGLFFFHVHLGVSSAVLLQSSMSFLCFSGEVVFFSMV